MSRKSANALLLLTAALWGMGFICTQYVIEANFSAVQLAAARFVVGAAFLTLVFRKKLRNVSKETFFVSAFLGALMAFGLGLQIYGQKYSTPSTCAFITAVYVIIVPFLESAIFRKAPRPLIWVCAAATLVGVCLISVTDSLTVSLGAALTLIATLFFAAQVALTELFVKKHDPVALGVVGADFIAVCATVLAVIIYFIDGRLPVFNTGSVMSLLYMGLAGTGICLVMQNLAQKYTTASQASIIMSTECIFGSAFSVILLGEALGIRLVAGSALIVASIVISNINFNTFKQKSDKTG